MQLVRSSRFTQSRLFRNLSRPLGPSAITKRTMAKFVDFGDVRVSVDDSKKINENLIPNGALDGYIGRSGLQSTEIFEHLRWIAQKYRLGQDIYLAGHPGPLRRHLALAFADICGLEVEYVTISKDTTESDLKQRKEIVGDSVLYADQGPVRAAIHGRLLILDGIENAERNVLPTLNNLLENREMSLDDGRFLTNRNIESHDAKLVKVHDDFRIIALGLPVPPYSGRTLDPPLRSRFQSRFIDEPALETLLEMDAFKSLAKDSSTNKSILELYESMRSIRASAINEGLPMSSLPLYSLDAIKHSINLLESNQNVGLLSAVSRCAPGATWLRQFVAPRFDTDFRRLVDSISRKDNILSKSDIKKSSHNVAKSLMPSQVKLLADMETDHNCGKHICILGPKGSGKSHLARAFADINNQKLRMFPLYQELTSRDLLQRRCTDAEGNTSWLDSPLIAAARAGDICVMDGVDRIDSQALSTLRRLIQDGEIDLPNGERLSSRSLNPETSIHPSFRILGLGLPPVHPEDARDRWISSDLGFSYHNFAAQNLSNEVTSMILGSIAPENQALVRTVLLNLEKAGETTPELKMSLRHLLRLAKLLEKSDKTFAADLFSVLENMFLVKFLPYHIADKFYEAMEQSGVSRSPISSNPVSLSMGYDSITIGDITTAKRTPKNLEKIPAPLFYENNSHVKIMRNILRGFNVPNNSLLLIGNQGVGKNKLIDRVLELLSAEREYIQLHRDTSIQSLTVLPSLENGKITYEDSPMITAAKHGRVLVIDEADKADNSVVCVLKSLAEDGELVLYDGRRLLSKDKLIREGGDPSNPPDDVILIHDDFKLVVLANRPGFPFLGNNFFRELGDVFDTHVVENLDLESEFQLLRSYGPNVDEATVKKIVNSFAALRDEYNRGNLNYPFSAREAVAAIKHLQAFPSDGIASAIENIIGFDSLTPLVRKQIAQAFQDNGIPVSATPASLSNALPPVFLREYIPISDPVPIVTKISSSSIPSVPVEHTTMKSSDWKPHKVLTKVPYHIQSARLNEFTEEVARFSLPKNDLGEFPGVIVDMAYNKIDDTMAVLTMHPFELFLFRNIRSHMLPDNTVTANSAESLQCFHDRVEFMDKDVQYRLGSFKPSLFVNNNSAGNAKESSYYVVAPEVKMTFEVSDDNVSQVKMLTFPFKPQMTSTSNNNKSKKDDSIIGNVASKIFKSSNDSMSTSNVTQARGPLRIAAIDSPASNKAIMWFENEKNVYFVDFDKKMIRDVDLQDALSGASGLSEISNCKMNDDNIITMHMRDLDKQLISATVKLGSTASVDVNKFNVDCGQPMCNDATRSTGFFGGDLKHFAYKLGNDRHLTAWPRQNKKYQRIAVNTMVGENKVVNAYFNHTVSGRKSSNDGQDEVEIVDLKKSKVLTLDISRESTTKQSGKKSYSAYDSSMPMMLSSMAAPTSDSGNLLAVGYGDGVIRAFEVDASSIAKHLEEWKKLFGNPATRNKIISSERLKERYQGNDGTSKPRTGLSAPKHGKEDPNNDPHVGGNTWAGGTGGSDTAGLGGRGGPYRLDKGHQVHQVSEEAKAEVSEEARERARKMGQEALQKRLEEISMGKGEYEVYTFYRNKIENEINQLKMVMEEFSRRAKERIWLRHQSHGDLDDAKLVDGLTGDRLVFKRRGLPETGGRQDNNNNEGASVKRLQFVVDVSGSMYRFNGQDRRLERLLESVLLILESMPTEQGPTVGLEYAVTGHSGDSPNIPFLDFSDPRPTNEKEKLKILQEMHAHSQFTYSGDHTLEATKMAIETIVKTDSSSQADTASSGSKKAEHYVFVVSDANFRRYRISPEKLARIMQQDPRVQVHFILIASLGDEANDIARILPKGHSHVCFESTDLPAVFRKILTESGGAFDLNA